MRRYLLDSGIVSALAAKREPVYSRAIAAARAGHRLGIPTPIYGELVYGIEKADPASQTRAYRELRVALSMLVVWPFEKPAADRFGRVRAALRKKGVKMQVIDLQLAAVALTFGNCTVVTTDSDLSRVPGLAVENWAN